MVAFKVVDAKEIVILLFITLFVSSYAINLNIIAKEVQTMASVNSKKLSANAPVILNLQPNLVKTPKLLSKLLRRRQSETELKLKKTRALRRARSIAIPKLPLVPFIIPLIPRLFPILPSALVPSLKQRFPSLKKKDVLDHNKSKELSPKDKLRIFQKLKEMKLKGALSYPEYYRFRKILS